MQRFFFILACVAPAASQNKKTTDRYIACYKHFYFLIIDFKSFIISFKSV
jgi:hypothetical protein